MEHIITLDIGTMSMRASLFDNYGKSSFTSSYEYHSVFTPPGLVEQDPFSWHEAMYFTLKEAAGYAKDKGIRVSAISVTSQRASVIPVDEKGVPLYNAVTWQDKRSVGIVSELTERISLEDIYNKTGLRANPYFSLPKMLWFMKEQPEIYEKACKLIGVQDYIVHALTGKFITDWTQAARTMLMDITDFKWDDDMLHVSGIAPEKLCELCPPGTNAGGLCRETAGAFGLPEGTPVIIAGGDQQNAAVALNILKPGFAEANTGTGSFVIAYSDKPAFDKECRVLCSASAVPGKWIVEAGIFNTGAIYRWFREMMYSRAGGEKVTYREMDAEAAESPIGSNGVMLIPHFEGSAAPYWNPLAKGLFFNLSLGTKRGDMARAILEGISMEISDNLDLMEEMTGKIGTVSVAGGMTKSPLFNNIQANTFNKNIIRYPNSEASSMGAAISAFVSLGIYRTHEKAFCEMVKEEPLLLMPEIENASKYDRLKMRKRKLYKALNTDGLYEEFMEIVN